ncbi:MAG: DNA/RNA non-specific endonuclease [Ignavibacteriales bacterium]|nr:DNA/RNA non-specific endonuclease [Ignavibacteriales bacterium]
MIFRLHRFILVSLCSLFCLLHAQSLDFLPTHSSGTLVRHTAYTISFVSQHQLSEWVAYELTDSMTCGGVERSTKFVKDPEIPGGSADPKTYDRSGYDKGHLCPAADMKWSPDAMRETFFTSNIAPQLPRFNRIAWKHLEEIVRGWAREYGALFIVTGPVLRDSLPFLRADAHVSIPELFFKVILDYRSAKKKAIAFLMPNRECTSGIQSYVVPIDSVEALTHLDFFSALPDSLENELESRAELGEWGIVHGEFSRKKK